MVEIGIPLWQLQVATSIGLIGVWIGWRGGMSKMVGFYDLPTATRLLLYGFFVGAIYQSAASSLVLDPLWTNVAFPLGPLLLLSLTLSLLTMFLLTREGVRMLNGQPTAGWTFGLGTGSMLVVLLIYRLISTTSAELVFVTTGFSPYSLIFGAILACLVPWSMAIICSWQGWHALEGRRFKPALKATLLHSMLLITIAIGLAYPIALFVLPAAIIWGQNTADRIWLPSGLSPRMKQEWTRLQRTGVSTGVRSVANEEEAE
ncbi:MAG: hypothetical protein QF722_00435 [Candidatus Thalassarchaeaceae archaeon]|nr:hypothetical protein [Candidatus Thalassarchaeaceae archaeon]MDP6844001.1 hypothetical protein [Candidatus Thalassarchaeaceae archaeon]